MTPVLGRGTTHHTFFFRESEQFEFLAKQGLKELTDKARQEGRTTLKFCSMACSRGQEVYSLAMFLTYHLPRIAPDFTFEILGSDVDAESVKIAANGVYRFDEIKSVPAIYLGTHWARGTGEIAAFVKAKSSLKAHCRFEVNNLLHLANTIGGTIHDAIFCRNVFIYFKPEQIEAITKGIERRLNKAGYLFLGISETLTNIKTDLTALGNSIYTKKPATSVPAATAKVEAAPRAASKALLRVLAVDDSPTVLSLLKSILTPDFGFELVGTAKNGKEAENLVRSTRFDVMTLDIHMPEMNGLEYLKKNFNERHPPVVVVSSVSREEASLGIGTLKAGASDYVEKPTLTDLTTRAEEIRTKLRVAISMNSDRSRASAQSLALAESFKKRSKVDHPRDTARILVLGTGDVKNATAVLKQLSPSQPPTVLVLDCPANLTEAFKVELQQVCSGVAPLPADAAGFSTDKIYVASIRDPLGSLKSLAATKRTSMLVFATATDGAHAALWPMPSTQLLVEDTASELSISISKWSQAAHRLVPYTSFLFDSDEYLNRLQKAS